MKILLWFLTVIFGMGVLMSIAKSGDISEFSKSMIKVMNKEGKEWYGSGVVVKADAKKSISIFITANHEVRESNRVYVEISAEKRVWGKVIKRDEERSSSCRNTYRSFFCSYMGRQSQHTY